MNDKPKGGLPVVGGSGRSLSNPGASKTGGLPSLSGTAKSSTGVSPLEALKQRSVGERVSTSQITIAAILDYTASTAQLVTSFVSRVGEIIKKDRPGVELSFIPIVFGGDGSVKVGAKGQAGFYGEQRNIQGPTYVFRSIQAGLHSLGKDTGIITVITDDPPSQDPDITSGNYDTSVIQKIQLANHTLLVIVDTSENRASFEDIVAEYRNIYGNLGDNLIIIGGAQNPNPIVDAVIAAKANKMRTGNSSSIGGQLPSLLRGKGGGGNLQIATGSSTQILGISDQSK